MAIVVDASVLAAIVFGEPDGPAMASYLEDETLVAPALIDFELANIGVKKLRRNPEKIVEILAAFERSQGLRIERIVPPRVALTTLAAETGLTAYDAAYLWIAMSRDADLVTLDEHLARVDARVRNHR